MRNRFVSALVVMAALLSHAGCGNPPGLYPVQGQVLQNGEPAAGAVVYFHREDSPGSGSTIDTIPFGIVEDDGRFTLSCDERGNGCPSGKYAVLVEWRDSTGDGVVPIKAKGRTPLVKRGRVRTGPDRLKGRYLDISKPLLHAEVLPQSNTLAPFEVGG